MNKPPSFVKLSLQAGLYVQAMAGYIRSSEQSRLDYYALLDLADFIASYLKNRGLLTDGQAREMHEAHKAVLVELLQDQGERLSTQSAALKFCQALEDLLAQGKIYLAKRSQPSIDEQKKAELVGWYGLHRIREKGVLIERGQRLFLLTKPCLVQVREYYRHSGNYFDTGPDTIRRQMWQEGFIERPRSEARYEQRIWIRALGKQVRVMVVDPAKVKAVTGIELIETVVDPDLVRALDSLEGLAE